MILILISLFELLRHLSLRDYKDILVRQYKTPKYILVMFQNESRHVIFVVS